MEGWHKRQGGANKSLDQKAKKQKRLTCLEEPKAVLDLYCVATRMKHLDFHFLRFNTVVK